MRNRPPTPSSAAFLLLGLAAGAAITWAINNGAKEKLTSGAFGDFIPKDLVEKATRFVQEGRDRVIEAVDSTSERFKA